MRTLSKRQVLLIYSQLMAATGVTAGLRDDGLLEAALAAPVSGVADHRHPNIY